jgi:hypothetical protein
VHTGFLCRNLREKDHLENLGEYGDNIKMDIREIG